MRKWLARFSFTFLIIAGVLGFEAYRALTDPERAVENWRLALYIAGAAVCVVLWLVGVRERHRGLRGAAENQTPASSDT